MSELYERPDRAKIAARIEAERQAAEPLPPAERCKACGYLVTAIGHRVMCGPPQA